jgi:hypothetical protein
MARKATDLLDVFRFNNEEEEGGHESKQRRKAAARAASAAGKTKAATARKKKSRGASDGITLSARQLLLASCAGVLLLVLSFTLGLATGSPSGSAPTEAPLARQTLVMIRATVPLVDPASRQKADPERIRRQLMHEFPIKSQHLQIHEEGAHLVLEIGPFTSEQKADAFRRSTGLELAHINMQDPFRWVDIVPYLRR